MITSFRASLSNLVPMLVLGVVLFIASIFASIPLMLGWLVLFPVSVGAVYASTGDLFGSGDAVDPGAAPPLDEP